MSQENQTADDKSYALNTLSPAAGSKPSVQRRGRGIGSGRGKTCGRGHKGLKSRSGGRSSAAFEGGQIPLQMRLPKYGFRSRISLTTAQLRLGNLRKIPDADSKSVSLKTLQNAGLIGANIKRARIFLSGQLETAVHISDSRILCTKGALKALEKAGGSFKAAEDSKK
ncbi:MAG: 50S ribosomal protein L15 [Gammaproteobacteria bacterium]